MKVINTSRCIVSFILLITTQLACVHSGLANPNDGLTILYGNSLVERLQEEGSFESYMHAAHPGRRVQYRSLAYTGDQVHFRMRPARFNDHLKYLLEQWQADRVLMAFGGVEAYQGERFLTRFQTHLDSYIDTIKDRHPDCDYVLISPVAAERVSSLQLPNLEVRNRNLRMYRDAMLKVAERHEIAFVDLLTPTLELFKNSDKKYTYDGRILNDLGAQKVGQFLFSELSASDPDFGQIRAQEGFQALRELVSRKTAEVAQTYHPQNGISYYGLRARDYEYEAEIPHFLKITRALDDAIWKQAQDLSLVQPKHRPEILSPDVPSKAPNNGLGTIKTTSEDLRDFTVLDGFEVNCFASSEDHPELVNPLQINFDAAGRLWVACFASYPHPLPGALGEGKILIFEDTDGDGKADQKIVFADGLSLPDGFTFYKKGIIASVSRRCIYLEDTDGDSIADYEEEILRGFDNTDTHHSGYLSRTPQGDLLVSEGLFHRCQFPTPHGVVHTKDTAVLSYDLATRKLTPERQTNAPNPWKITFNRFGESMHYYGGGHLHDADLYNVWLPMGSVASKELGMPFRYDKGCGAQFVDSPNFPEDWQGGLLTTHLLRDNEVSFTRLKLVDGTYKAAGEKQVLISSVNKSFRPSDLTFGLDGALYISDFYYPIIGHAQHANRDKNRDHANGRIWRVVNNNKSLVAPVDFKDATVDTLLSLLAHPLLKVRQIARVELENVPVKQIQERLRRKPDLLESDDQFALEGLWLYERMKDFSETALLERLLRSEDPRISWSATRSLRWWAPYIDDHGISLARSQASSADKRTKIALVSVGSHLQRKYPEWGNVIESIEADLDEPVAYLKEMASWKDRPGLSPEFPILNINPETIIPTSHWLTRNKREGDLYFKSSHPGELVVGHIDCRELSLSANDAPVLTPRKGDSVESSHNRIAVNKGINKISYKQNGPRNRFQLYLADQTGNKAEILSFAASKIQHTSWAKQYEQNLKDNWEKFALSTYQTYCANCHAVDTKTAGPALRGLLGKEQTVIYADGSKNNIKIDRKYLYQSIKDPMSAYAEGSVPGMPPIPLSNKQVEYLVKWITSLK